MSQILQMPGVPESSKQLLLRLMQEDLIAVEALRAVVEQYRRVIHDAARKNGRANTVVGDAIAGSLQALLARMNETTGPDNHLIIQAAVRYFVIQNDGNGNDLESEDGLYDDARVVNAVMHYFGLDRLKIPNLPEPAANRRPAPVRGGAAAPARR